MPVECDMELLALDQEMFHAIDRVVMRHAFDIHNKLGRFFDEAIYQEELAKRCRDSGYEVSVEVPLRVFHEKYEKPYYLDMIVERSFIYELKAVEDINKHHEMQLINYLLLANLCHGKLLNFRPYSVQSRFVSTNLNLEKRRAFRLITNEWSGDDSDSQRLAGVLNELMSDWGAFLDVNLYKEALLYLLSGPDSGIRLVNIDVDCQNVGKHKMCMLNERTAWHISAIRHHKKEYERNIMKLLNHTNLREIQWINLEQAAVRLKTLVNDFVT